MLPCWRWSTHPKKFESFWLEFWGWRGSVQTRSFNLRWRWPERWTKSAAQIRGSW